MSGEVVRVDEGRAPAVASEMSVNDLVQQVAKIQQAKQAVMRLDEHYGVIPGTPKPTLYKSGAEKLCLLFRLAPKFETREEREGNHLTVYSTCTLIHIPTQNVMGSGQGCCSTHEKKYAWRDQNPKCPKCGKETIFRSKNAGEGYYCWRKKDGCGATFAEDAKAITDQPRGRVENPDLPDCWNVAVKMANKRALVAAILVTTGGSDLFTQDLEDLEEVQAKVEAKEAAKQPPPATKAPAPPQRTVEPEYIPPGGAEQDDGCPSDLKRVLDAIAAAQTPLELAACAAAASELEESLRADARAAYKARLAVINGGKK